MRPGHNCHRHFTRHGRTSRYSVAAKPRDAFASVSPIGAPARRLDLVPAACTHAARPQVPRRRRPGPLGHAATNRRISPSLRSTDFMARKASLSGFPEWLPQERAVEQHVLDTLRRIFELHGFANIETRAVETVGQLLRKGEIDKEVYGLSRAGRRGSHRQARPQRAGPALRPHRPLRPLRGGKRRTPGLPLPPLPDAEGLARRTPAGRPLPRIHPGRHRRGGRRRPAVPLRRGTGAGHRRGAFAPCPSGTSACA